MTGHRLDSRAPPSARVSCSYNADPSALVKAKVSLDRDQNRAGTTTPSYVHVHAPSQLSTDQPVKLESSRDDGPSSVLFFLFFFNQGITTASSGRKIQPDLLTVIRPGVQRLLCAQKMEARTCENTNLSHARVRT